MINIIIIYLTLNILCLGHCARHCGDSQIGMICGTFLEDMIDIKINSHQLVYTKCPAIV